MTLQRKKLNCFTAISQPQLPRIRKAPSRLEIGIQPGVHPYTAKENYRRLYQEALDLFINATKQRFNQPAFQVYLNLETLLLKAVQGEDSSKEKEKLSKHFNNDINVTPLSAQLSTFQVFMKNQRLQSFHDILNAVKLLKHEEQSFIYEVITLCKLVNVNPATSASGERRSQLHEE